MSDIGGSSYPIEIRSKETKQSTLLWIQTKKQERISQINHFTQAIQDLLKGKIPEIERQILHAQQELQQLEAHEKTIIASIDIEEIK